MSIFSALSLNNIFGNNGNHGGAGSLAVASPFEFDGDMPQEIADFYSLPAEATADDVLDAAEQAAEAQEEAWLHSKLMRHHTKTLEAYAKIYENQLQYSEQVMNVDQKIQQARLKYSRAAARYGFNSQEKEVQVNAYDSVYSSVGSNMNF